VSAFRILVSALCALVGIGEFASAQSLGLADLQALALRNNPAGLQAESLRQLGRAEISVARTWSDPLVEGLLGRGRPLGSDRSEQESGFQISQELFSPISYRHRIQAAEFGSAEREAQARARQLDLLFEVEGLYHEHVAAAEGVRLLAENAEGAERVLALISRRAEVGEARETESIRAEVESLRQQRSLAAARRETEITREALARIVGSSIPRAPHWRQPGRTQDRPATSSSLGHG